MKTIIKKTLKNGMMELRINDYGIIAIYFKGVFIQGFKYPNNAYNQFKNFASGREAIL